LRLLTTARRRARSAAVTSTMIPLRMAQTRTARASRESSKGLTCQTGCTRCPRLTGVVQHYSADRGMGWIAPHDKPGYLPTAPTPSPGT
jgi:hypothetical protein